MTKLNLAPITIIKYVKPKQQCIYKIVTEYYILNLKSLFTKMLKRYMKISASEFFMQAQR